MPADLTDEDDCRAIVRACEDRFDRLDGLVNSAGLTNRGTLDDTTVELWDRIFAVNVRAPFVLMQEAARLMRRGGDGGSVVNIITMASHGGEPVLTAYASSKGALATLTKNAGYQLQPDRIRVNGLNIGWTATEGEDATQRGTGRPADWREAADAASPLGRLMVPDDIAPMVTYREPAVLRPEDPRCCSATPRRRSSPSPMSSTRSGCRRRAIRWAPLRLRLRATRSRR